MPTQARIDGEVVNGDSPVGNVVVLLCTEDDGPIYQFSILGVLSANGRAPFFFQTDPMLPGSFAVAAYGTPATAPAPPSSGVEMTVQNIAVEEGTASGQPHIFVSFESINSTDVTIVEFRLWITIYYPDGEIIATVPVTVPPVTVAPGARATSSVPIPIQGTLPEGYTVSVRLVGFSEPLSGPPEDEPRPVEG